MPSESISREQRLQEILAAYMQDVEAGKNPDREKLLAQHPDLAEDLRSFLAENDRMRHLVNQADAATLAPTHSPHGDESAIRNPQSAIEPGTTIRYFGDYELLEEIARGGMGVVYKARQVSLNRIVALKMILAGELASPADVQRFHAEAKAAANLDHPNIVPIYEVGEHEGQHFFTMKLVVGGSLSGKAASGDWRASRVSGGSKDAQRQAATLTAAVARAVHHAHQRGILHRDLKPANILLASGGRKPPDTAGPSGGLRPPLAEYTPMITDFGLAKHVEADSGQTKSGAIVGTPSYMPPEQARSDKVLTTAVDVYSLGAILYELLTGQPPFRAETALQTLMMVLENEPAPPSSVNRGVAIDRDLEIICLKCLNKDPARRYGSAEMLAEDLERWLRGEPVLARSASRPERVLKWARRRPERAILYGLAILVLGIGLSWLTWQGGVAVVDRWARAQEAQRQLVFERRQLLEQAQNDLKMGRTSCQAGQLDVGMLTLARGLREAVALQAADLEGELRVELGRYAPLLPRLVAMSGHGAAKIYRAELIVELTYSLALNRDGKRLVAAGYPWIGRIHDVDTLAPRMLDPAFNASSTWAGSRVRGVAISADGSRFVDGEAVFSPDGKRLLAREFPLGGNPFSFLVSDPATGKAVGSFKAVEAAFSPDSSLIACDSPMTMLFDAVTGTARAPGWRFNGLVLAFAFSPDSKSLATVSWEENDNRVKDADANKNGPFTVRIWDVKTFKQSREPVLLFLHKFNRIGSLTFSPDGKLLLMTQGTGGDILQILDLDTGKTRWPNELIAISRPGGDPRYLHDGVRKAPHRSLFFSADSKTFWTGLYQWDTASGRLLGGVADQLQSPTGFTRSADGRRAAVMGMRQSTWHNTDETGKITGSETRGFETILVWDLSAVASEVKEEAQPLPGTPEQITLWLAAQTGREIGGDVSNMRDDLWLECREKLKRQ